MAANPKLQTIDVTPAAKRISGGWQHDDHRDQPWVHQRLCGAHSEVAAAGAFRCTIC
jgi:hypothetical protein